MPLAELVQPQRDNQPQRGKKGAIDRPIGLVTYPNCRVVMPRISLQPSQEENLHEAVYRCPQCGTETRRWIAHWQRRKRSNAPWARRRLTPCSVTWANFDFDAALVRVRNLGVRLAPALGGE